MSIPANIYAAVHLHHTKGVALTMKQVFTAVCEYYEIPERCLLKAAGRYSKIVLTRYMAIWICIQHVPGITMSELGRTLNMHHTTILHARESMRIRLVREKHVRNDYKAIMNILKK